VPHTYRKTVATVLDGQGLSARTIADQLGLARISMTQDIYMGRRTVDESAAVALELVAGPRWSNTTATQPLSSGSATAHGSARVRFCTSRPRGTRTRNPRIKRLCRSLENGKATFGNRSDRLQPGRRPVTGVRP
jgi:hypothetical protein